MIRIGSIQELGKATLEKIGRQLGDGPTSMRAMVRCSHCTRFTWAHWLFCRSCGHEHSSDNDVFLGDGCGPHMIDILFGTYDEVRQAR